METVILFIQKYMIGAIIAGIGGIANYIYKVSRGEKFSIAKLLLNMLLAGWIGYVVGEFLPKDALYNAYVSISGFCAYPILDFLETRGISVITKVFNASKNEK